MCKMSGVGVSSYPGEITAKNWFDPRALGSTEDERLGNTPAAHRGEYGGRWQFRYPPFGTTITSGDVVWFRMGASNSALLSSTYPLLCRLT